jgi:hypothetical protein
MRQSYRPNLPPKPQPYRTLVLDHLGLVAGMFEELGITEVINKATQQDPAMRIVTAGHAVKAMVLHGLGFIHQQLSLVVLENNNGFLTQLLAEGLPLCRSLPESLSASVLVSCQEVGPGEPESAAVQSVRPSAW